MCRCAALSASLQSLVFLQFFCVFYSRAVFRRFFCFNEGSRVFYTSLLSGVTALVFGLAFSFGEEFVCETSWSSCDERGAHRSREAGMQIFLFRSFCPDSAAA